MKPIVASTFCYFVDTGNRCCLVVHNKGESIKRQFKKLAKIYCGKPGRRVWTEDMKGNVLYDTDRGDHSAEVEKVRNTPGDQLPLLIGKIKTDLGTRELHKHITGGF
jgi:hypothetical protein